MAKKAAAVAKNEWLLTEREIDAKAKDFIKQHRPLLEVIGLYLKAFTDVEQQIERNIAHLLRVYNFETFDMLANKMPIAQKLRKLKQGAELRNSKIGPNISERLKLFDNECVVRRNRLAHGSAYLVGSNVVVTSMGRPLGDASNHRKLWPQARPPEHWSISDLKRRALWLQNFRCDLDVLAASTFRKPKLPKILDIANPLSGLKPDALPEKKAKKTGNNKSVRHPVRGSGREPELGKL